MWKDIPGYEGYYKISKNGVVKRTKYVRGKAIGIRKPSLSSIKGGWQYPRIELSKEGKTKHFTIHELVAMTFIGQRPHKHEINHIDGNKCNNYYKNIEYVTSSQNRRHAVRIGLLRSGSSNPLSKLNKKEVAQIFKLRKTGLFLHQLAKNFGVSVTTICNVLKRRHYKNHNPELLEQL